MKTIYKYELLPAGSNAISIEMAEGAEILCAQSQFAGAFLWALVDPVRPLVKRYFHVFGTGHRIDEALSLQYIGTFQLEGGVLVFHVFEVLDVKGRSDALTSVAVSAGTAASKIMGESDRALATSVIDI